MNEETRLVIATHDGRQHADEILACWFFHVLHGGEIQIVRTSDAAQLAHADVRLDCGGIYDPANGWIDHHGNLPNLPEPHPARASTFATAGLVWRLYGPRICELALEDAREGPWIDFRNRQEWGVLKALYERFSAILDQEIIAPIDAWDVGVYPDKSLSRQLLPFQWVLPHMDFEVAMTALGKAFIQRLRTLAETVACEDNLERDMIHNGPCEFWVYGPWLIVKAPAGKRVELRAAKKFAGSVLHMPLLGVLSSLRGGTRWGAFLTSPLPYAIKIPGDLEFAAGRRSFFHDDPMRLLQFLKSCVGEKALHVPFGRVESEA